MRLGIEVFPHHIYSPYLSETNYQLFQALGANLREQQNLYLTLKAP